jgi:uncharacterized protein with von Willebrand factor type A (vWA) domain
MLIEFFLKLKQAGLPVSIKEFLTLLEGLDKRVISGSIDDFYYLSRACLVKDESNYDKFDRAFGAYFKGITELPDGMTAIIPEEWLKKLAEKYLTEEEKKLIESLGGWEKLMETLKKRLEEQKGRHQGGSKWIGTGRHEPVRRLRLQPGRRAHRPARIPAPASGQGVGSARVQESRRLGRARHAQHQGRAAAACASSRAPARPKSSISTTPYVRLPGNAGYLDLKMVPERHNSVKGAAVSRRRRLDGRPHQSVRAAVFSDAHEFKHLEYFYFHNFLYERVWKDNRRRGTERIATLDVMHKYPHDYKVIFVGDATMSPYEITYPGGSVEHTNPEAGAVWLQRMLTVYKDTIWLNPQPQAVWEYHESIRITRELIGERMFPLTLDGLDRGMRLLSKGH